MANSPDYHKKRYQRFVDSGTCVYCQGVAIPGYRHCDKCRDRKRKSQETARVSRKSLGLCPTCGIRESPDGGVVCHPCRIKQISYNRTLKTAVMEYYGGGVCSCCGEDELAFLSIDHIDGGGNQHRKSLGLGGAVFYKWLKRNGFPSGFQVLCHNCNHGKHVNGGICPHQQVKDDQCLPSSS